MVKVFPSLMLAAALCTISPGGSADPLISMPPLKPTPRRCAPGTQVACSCGDGGTGFSAAPVLEDRRDAEGVGQREIDQEEHAGILPPPLRITDQEYDGFEVFVALRSPGAAR